MYDADFERTASYDGDAPTNERSSYSEARMQSTRFAVQAATSKWKRTPKLLQGLASSPSSCAIECVGRYPAPPTPPNGSRQHRAPSTVERVETSSIRGLGCGTLEHAFKHLWPADVSCTAHALTECVARHELKLGEGSLIAHMRCSKHLHDCPECSSYHRCVRLLLIERRFNACQGTDAVNECGK
jgi:hypothetical protein